jgi:phytanoyl-CoA hydroxylase
MTRVQLSAEQSAAYKERGFFIVRSLFARDLLERFEDRFLSLVHHEQPKPEGMLLMRDVMVAKGAVAPASSEQGIAKIQDLQADPLFFRDYVCAEPLLDWIEAILGTPDLKAVHTMLINKPPHVDGRHPLHQDLLYFPFRPADGIVAAWTAIGRCTRENGCLVAVPGTHRGGLLEHGNPDWEWLNRGYFGARGVGEQTEREHLEMEPGDTVFFHPLLLHGSGQNRTEGYRRSISAHYADARCRYLDERQVVRPGSRPYRLVRGSEHPGCI